jgi:hypothetical protein
LDTGPPGNPGRPPQGLATAPRAKPTSDVLGNGRLLEQRVPAVKAARISPGETTPEGAPRRLRLRSWKPIAKPGSALIGLAGVAIPVGSTWLDIDDLPILTTNGKVWAAWPGKPVIAKDGTLAKIPGTGKTHFVNILRWEDSEIAKRFSAAVVELVRAEDPAALDEGAP